MKTLVIILGNHRGGEETWLTMYKYLLQPLDADLALINNTFDDNFLCKKAKFLWKFNLNEDDLSKSLKNYYDDNFKGQQLYDFFSYHKNTGLSGFGLDPGKRRGSGDLLFAFRHFVLKNFSNNIIDYDWIILTRSDHYYINFHTDVTELDKKFVYVLPDETYGGVCDRHTIFHSSIANKVLGIAEFFADIKNKDLLFREYIFENHKYLNCEKALKLYFDSKKLKLKAIRRCQFTVALASDKTNWHKATILLPGRTDLYLKYQDEYVHAYENLKLQVKFEIIFKKYIYVYYTGHKLIRLGGENDGGYLVPDLLLKEIKYIFSLGVSNETSFEKDCYKKKITPFLLDGTIDYNGPFNFIKKNLNIFSDDKNITLREWLNNANIEENENNLMLKIDISGKEWDILDNIELSLLKKFKIIVINFYLFAKSRDLEKISSVFSKLNKDFTICHIHPNNNGFNFVNVKGFEIKSRYEFTYINNTSLLERKKLPYSLPHVLDRPNDKGMKDSVLPDFFYK